MSVACVDDRGVTIRLDAPPARIVSLVPSTTRTLFDLGVGGRVVGVTRFCVDPAEARSIARIGGTKDADPARIAALRPDLVLGNCEENTRAIFEAVEAFAPLYAAFPRTVDEALADLRRMADLIGADAGPLLARITAARARAAGPPRRVAYLIWRRPYMTVGGDTFIDAMLREAGWTNVFADRARYPETTVEELVALDPDLVLLSSEPFRFGDRHVAELRAAGLRGVQRTDGRWWSWHGSAMEEAFHAIAAMTG